MSRTRWLAFRRSDAPAQLFMKDSISPSSSSSESSLSSRYDQIFTPLSLSAWISASVRMVSRPRRLCSETMSMLSRCVSLTADSSALSDGRFLNSAPLTPSSENT